MPRPSNQAPAEPFCVRKNSSELGQWIVLVGWVGGWLINLTQTALPNPTLEILLPFPPVEVFFASPLVNLSSLSYLVCCSKNCFNCTQARSLLLLSGFGTIPPQPLVANTKTQSLTITPRQMAMQCARPDGCHVHLFVPQQSPTEEQEDASSPRWRMGDGGVGRGGTEFSDREITVYRV